MLTVVAKDASTAMDEISVVGADAKIISTRRVNGESWPQLQMSLT